MKTRSIEGMTLVEILIAMGMASVLFLALSQMTYFSALSIRAQDSVDELNSNIALLVNAVNVVRPYNGSYADPGYSQSGGCNQIFYLMPANTVSLSPLSSYYANTPLGTTVIQITKGSPGLIKNNLQINSVNLSLIDGPISFRPDGSSSYIYQIEIHLQLWVLNGAFVGCG